MACHNGSVNIGRRLKNCSGPAGVVGVDADRGQFLRTFNREGAHADGIHQLEDGGIGAGAERECQDRDDREGRVLAQQPEAVAEVLPDGFNEAQGVHVVDLLADLRGVAEPPVRRHGGGLWRHAARDVVVDFVSEMGLELAGTLIVPAAAAEEP